MIELEVFGSELLSEPLSFEEIQSLCARALAAAGVRDGHLAVEFIGAGRIAELNERHRRKAGPTDVLSFPIDGACPQDGGGPDGGGPPRELGDVVICPEHTADLREAVVHGALHLVGMDHETDNGEMLALQARLLRDAAVGRLTRGDAQAEGRE